MKHTTKTLRDVVLTEMDSLVSGKSTHSRARAVASLAKAAIATAQFEIQSANHSADRGKNAVPVELN